MLYETDSRGYPNVLYVERNKDGLWLNANYANPDNQWAPGIRNLIPELSYFLEKELNLSLHPDKVFIKTLSSGIDFLGWVNFPYHRILRTSTKRRMFKRLKQRCAKETIASYLGLLKHGDMYRLAGNILNDIIVA